MKKHSVLIPLAYLFSSLLLLGGSFSDEYLNHIRTNNWVFWAGAAFYLFILFSSAMMIKKFEKQKKYKPAYATCFALAVLGIALPQIQKIFY